MQMFSDGLFRDQRVIVTGGGTGIGKETARQFASLGAKVFIGSRKEENIRPAAEELSEETGNEVGWSLLDTRDVDRVGGFVDDAVSRMGGVDILVNNAGGQFPSPAEMITPNGFDAVIRNNLHGTWFVTQAVFQKAFMPQKSGKIVSVVANMWRGFPGIMHTGAARAAVVNMTQSLAVEWARLNIQVNAVAPGVIKTGGLKVYPKVVIDNINSKIPMKRMGTAEETAATILFLCSPGAGFMTGATIRMDGGQSLWGDTWVIPDPEGGDSDGEAS